MEGERGQEGMRSRETRRQKKDRRGREGDPIRDQGGSTLLKNAPTISIPPVGLLPQVSLPLVTSRDWARAP